MNTLDTLPADASARVHSLQMTGDIRSRLQDIGLIPGTLVTCVQVGSGLAAYRLRGAVIALRHADAMNIVVRKIETSPLG